MKLLKSKDYFEVSLLYNLAISLIAAFNSRDSTFINLIISIIRELSIYKLTIIVILLLNSR